LLPEGLAPQEIVDGFKSGCLLFEMRRAHDAALREIPVVVVSGNSPTGAPLPGIGGYFRKPINLDLLIEVIDCAF
jgi:hypothetical protein